MKKLMIPWTLFLSWLRYSCLAESWTQNMQTMQTREKTEQSGGNGCNLLEENKAESGVADF